MNFQPVPSYDMICIVINGEKSQSHTVILTLIGQCPISNSSELFSYTKKYSCFKLIGLLFCELSCTQHTHADTQPRIHAETHAEGHEYFCSCG